MGIGGGSAEPGGIVSVDGQGPTFEPVKLAQVSHWARLHCMRGGEYGRISVGKVDRGRPSSCRSVLRFMRGGGMGR